MMKRISFIVALFAFTTYCLNAQVGINTNNPNQELDVNGKVKIGNDGRTPTEGTVRYSADGDFEGYTAEGWQSFTAQRNGPLPNGAIPVIANDTGISVGSVDVIIFDYADGSSSFSTVPAGKFVLVSSIQISSNNLGTTGSYAATIRPALNGSVDFNRSLLLQGDRTSIQQITDPYGLLTVLRPGDQLQVVNENTSDFPIRAQIRGFLVDDLEY